MRLLVVEDDPGIVENLSAFLRMEQFEVDDAQDEETAKAKIDAQSFDLLLVDITLARGTGFGVCRKAKACGLPIIFLTAAGDEATVVSGLDMGADDFVSKPFRPRELLSRIRSVLRRSGRSQSVLRCGELCVDTDKGVASLGQEELSLSVLEYRLLLRLMLSKGKPLSRDELLQELWDAAGDYVNDNTLTVYIKRLREKLGSGPDHPEYIRTIRAIGYQLGE